MYVTFEDYVLIDRAGTATWVTQTSQVIVPVLLEYPLTVDVSMNDLRVYSESSIDVDFTLNGQTVQNSSPYSVKFSTYLGRSFAISLNQVSYFNGSFSPALIEESTDATDTFINTITRVQHWNVAITPGNGMCQFDGFYLVDATIYWTGIDENGNVLNSTDNPIPNNDTVSFGFQLDSQYFCATTITNTLSATMVTYLTAPAASGGHVAQTPNSGYLQNDVLYFRAVVTSLNLPIASTALTTLTVQQGINAAIPLVTASNSVILNIAYALTNGDISNEPANETNWKLTAHPDVFTIDQDRSLLYDFDAVLTVTYQSGLKKRMSLRQSSAPVGQVSAKATVSVQRAAEQPSAGTVGMSASITLARLSVFLGLCLLVL